MAKSPSTWTEKALLRSARKNTGVNCFLQLNELQQAIHDWQPWREQIIETDSC